MRCELRAGRRRSSPPGRAGVTLIELLLVVSLAALVLGMGLGSIASLDLGARSAAGEVQGALRSASNWAVARRAPARVRIERAARRLTIEGQQVIGTWHFESDPPRGAFGLDGELAGAALVDDGFLGRALSFAGRGPNARYQVSVHRSPSFDLGRGFRVQLALRPEEAAPGRVLQIGDVIGIEVGRGLGLDAWFAAVRPDESGAMVGAGKARARSVEGVLRVGEWNRVSVDYDRRALRIEVEGVRVGEVEESAQVAPLAAPLVLGGGDRPWQGAVDSLVVSAVTAEQALELPETTSFSADTPEWIAFAAGGGLDRTLHREPLRFAIEFLDGRRVPILVSLYGGVE